MTDNPNLSPQELVALGEQIYFEKKDKLEEKHLGEYAVIEVETKDITIDPDELAAVKKAQKKHPGKLFYLVQIGNLRSEPNVKLNEIKHGWAF